MDHFNNALSLVTSSLAIVVFYNNNNDDAQHTILYTNKAEAAATNDRTLPFRDLSKQQARVSERQSTIKGSKLSLP